MKQSLMAAIGLAFASAACAAVPRVSIETLFGTNYVRSAILSPDGSKVAFLAPSKGTYGLAILDLVTHKVTNPVHIEGEDIESIAWKGNDRLIFTGTISGNEGGPQVASTDLEGKKVFSILKAQEDKNIFSLFSGRLVSPRKSDPGHIYVFGYTLRTDFDDRGFYAATPMIMKVNVVNGDRIMVCSTEEGGSSSSLGDFGVDQEGRVRTAYRSIGDYSEFLYRDESDQPWRTVRRFHAQAEGWNVVGFEGDGPGVYIVDHETSDVGALRVFDPATQQLGPSLFTPEEGEIDSIIMSPDGKRLLGVRYTTE
jgi:hypothetical protein